MVWDVTALSYYCVWHGTLTNLYNVITDVRTRYGKPVVIAETAYQFTWTQNTARGAGAVGVFYWEPTWYAVKGNGWNPADIDNSGNGWDNMAIFNWSGQVNPSVVWTP